MICKTFQFDFKDLKLTVLQIEKVLGYSDKKSEVHFSDLIEKTLGEAEEVSTIKAEYRIFDDVVFNDVDKTVSVNDITFEIRKIVYGQLKKSESAALFLCTAGVEIGRMSRQAMKDGDLLGGYIYDVVGSEIVEAAADLMQADLERAMASSGRRITNRFSPGYCGWDVSEQHKLFQLIPGTYCGIRLTDSALMDPEKSVSGMIGIGKNVRHLPYTCSICDMKDCIYRKQRSK
ncbi:MAG: vitamin B12 dependent-methionine synthase activation domain-containing protein [Bacteroidales bacterium]